MLPNRIFSRWLASLCTAILLLSTFSGSASAAEKPTFTLAWSIYAGWMPWPYAADKGIIKKWADKYGINIVVKQLDYIESINQYTAGKFDACLMASMDALTIPAAGGVDTTVFIVGDYSNGNDGIILKGKQNLKDIKGQKVNLVELSVSHYFLARALSTVGLSEKDIKTVNTSDADVVAAWKTPGVTAMVAWNPQLAEIRKQPNTYLVMDSTKVPGEILDTAAIHTETLKAHPEFAKALAGAWFETLALMHKDDAVAKAARTEMAKLSGTDLPGYEAQLKTTKLFYTPKDTLDFTNSPVVANGMDLVRKFSFQHGLLGQGAPDVNVIGISFPSGKVLGNPKNVKLRFDDSIVKMAVAGKL